MSGGRSAGVRPASRRYGDRPRRHHRQARGARSRVGLCDLTRGEMWSNGTPDERVTEAEAARKVLGAAWRENLALPDRAIGSTPDHLAHSGRAHPPLTGRARSRFRTGRIAIPTTSRLPRCSATRCSTPSCGATQADGEPWKPEWVCYYFINDSGPASFVVDVSAHYDIEAAGAGVLREPVLPRNRFCAKRV